MSQYWLNIIEDIIVHKISSNQFVLEELYEYEDYLKDKFPDNNNIHAKIRQTLQFLRDQDKIIFLERGSYRKTKYLFLLSEQQEILTDDKIKSTIKEVLIQTRLGQGSFKKSLQKEFKDQCIVTEAKLFLVASHIKPWRYASDKERLDSKNGLLLARHIDAFFDAGCITFDDQGILLKSNDITDDELRKYGIENFINKKILILCNERQKYLKHHQEFIFK